MQEPLEALSHVDTCDEEGDDLPCEVDSLADEEETIEVLKPEALVECLHLDDFDLLEGVEEDPCETQLEECADQSSRTREDHVR